MDPKPVPSVSLVLPVKDGESFLDATLDRALAWLEKREPEGQLVVVDDGSRDSTGTILSRRDHSRMEVLTHRENRGKGAAVRTGMLAARGELRIFLDAGLTYPLENVDRILASLRSGADLAIGVRVHPGSRYVVAPRAFRRLYSRHLMGRIFNRLVRALAVPEMGDTQCGIKGFTAGAAVRIFSLAKVSGFAFDVEVLFLARRLGLSIAEVPVLFVYEEEPSTLRLFADGYRALRDVAGLRRRARNGGYDETSR